MRSQPTDQVKPPLDTCSVSNCLRNEKEHIIKTFEKRLRNKVRAASNASRAVIVNTLPAFIENLAEALMPNYPRILACEGSSIAQEHGNERARVAHWNPSDIVLEYQTLRDTILELLNAKVQLSTRDQATIITSIDQALSESIAAYLLVQDNIREQIANSLTHDLRTPLSAIKTSAEMMIRNPDNIDKNISLAKRVIKNSIRIDQMIQDLLDVSSARSGKPIELRYSECNLLNLVMEIVDQLTLTHGDRFNVEGRAITGIWDPDALKRAFENLLVNAIKYGDPHSQVHVSITSLEERVIVSIHNKGNPIPREEQDTLFQVFQRAQQARQTKTTGWGLGLSLVRVVTEAHGGSIGVDSSPERGTTFIMDFPQDSRPFQNTIQLA